MSFVAGRDGKISIFRVGLIAGVLGIILIVGGLGSFFLDNNSFKQPLDIAPYPSAESAGIERGFGTSQNAFFLVPGVSPEDVEAYYEQKLIEHNGNNEEGCTRIPFEGSFPNSDQLGVVPYEFKCAFNRSGLGGGFQSTIITIQPGVFNENPVLNTQGKTVVRYEQRWEP